MSWRGCVIWEAERWWVFSYLITWLSCLTSVKIEQKNERIEDYFKILVDGYKRKKKYRKDTKEREKGATLINNITYRL